MLEYEQDAQGKEAVQSVVVNATTESPSGNNAIKEQLLVRKYWYLGVIAILMSAIIALSVVLANTLKVKETIINPTTKESITRSIYDRVTEQTKDIINAKNNDKNTKNASSQVEMELNEKYNNEFFNKYYEFLATNPEPDELLNYIFDGFGEYETVVFGKLSGLYDNSETNPKQTRDFFVGITISASDCIAAWNWVLKQSGYVGQALTDFGNYILATLKSDNVVEIGKLLWKFAGAIAGIAAIISAVVAMCAAIPVIGWIAIGILAGIAAKVGVTYLVSGAMGRGFRLGVVVRQGWFGIPIGIRFVCG